MFSSFMQKNKLLWFWRIDHILSLNESGGSLDHSNINSEAFLGEKKYNSHSEI